MAVFNTYDVITPRNIHFGDDNIIKAIIMGSIDIEIKLKNKTRWIYINDALYIPKL